MIALECAAPPEPYRRPPALCRCSRDDCNMIMQHSRFGSPVGVAVAAAAPSVRTRTPAPGRMRAYPDKSNFTRSDDPPLPDRM